ncbi:hypothetical protein BLNAU_22318 [Blattamonas nauphoetae]|uniref:Uncharacterized protein n=1 Tax=Blattamonas nauphoetae TaxID=2049346 RepID=A0ABQ9WTW5_9EUKA|nr:hypothetical protein BLNAU_22318 [Blattamonas nauphoetae]
MSGQVLDKMKTYEIALSDSRNFKKTIEMAFNPTSSEWEVSAILYSRSESEELEYGLIFSVSGFKTKGETSLCLQLSGNGFIGKYSVTLNSGFSFNVNAESATSAVSEIALGLPDSLTFDTPFTVLSIVFSQFFILIRLFCFPELEHKPDEI